MAIFIKNGEKYMYKNCREELLAVMTEYVKEKGENEFTRAEVIVAMRRAGTKYTPGTVSAHISLDAVLIFQGIINQCMMIMRKLVRILIG